MKHVLAIIAFAALAIPATALADSQLTAVGSTALLPLVKAAAAKYEAEHADLKISVSGGGSFVGIAQASSGVADLGDSDVIAPGNSGLLDHKVCVVGFTIAVNPEANVKNLTAAQVRGIFGGKISNWKQVGGADKPITVINRPRTSGTRFVFKATMMGTTPISEGGITEDSSGTVTEMVAKTPGAITYVSRSYVEGKNDVVPVSIDGVTPSIENIRSGKWKIWSYEHIFTHGAARPDAQKFIDFITNDKDDLEKLGYIQISTMKVREMGR